MDKRLYIPVIGVSGLILIIISLFLEINSAFGWLTTFIGASLLLIPFALVLWKRLFIASSLILGGVLFFFTLAIAPFILQLFGTYD